MYADLLWWLAILFVFVLMVIRGIRREVLCEREYTKVATERNVIAKRLREAEDRIYDMYLQDDAQAYDEAGKYMRTYRSDLWVKALRS